MNEYLILVKEHNADNCIGGLRIYAADYAEAMKLSEALFENTNLWTTVEDV